MTQDLYILQEDVTGNIKVGRSKDVPWRVKTLQCGNPLRLKVLLVAPGLGHRELDIHRRLLQFRCRRGGREWFTEASIGSLPDDIFEMFPVEILENPDWWVYAD